MKFAFTPKYFLPISALISDTLQAETARLVAGDGDAAQSDTDLED